MFRDKGRKGARVETRVVAGEIVESKAELVIESGELRRKGQAEYGYRLDIHKHSRES